MADQKRLAKNVIANIGQTLASVILLFALYRYINFKLGVDQLGVSSVVLATASASRLADLGLSAGVIRFVAHDRACNDSAHAVQVIDTVALTLAIFVGVLLPIVYWLISTLLPNLFVAEYLLQARSILPYALISLWLTMLTGVFQGGLEGCQRMDARAVLLISGQILMLLLAFWWVPRQGLLGLAWAQLGQGLFLLCSNRLALCRMLPGLTWLPRKWRMQVLQEIYKYSANVQAATLFGLLFDPVTKALMARFGGVSVAGYFEMANQVVMKARSVIVMANQAIVPHVASLNTQESDHLVDFYRQNIRILIFVTLPAFTLLIAWSCAFSWLLAHAYQSEFVFLLVLLAAAWGFNIFAGPAYFINLGTGHVGRNTLSHIVMGAINAGLGWIMGSLFGPHGVVFAYAVALLTASIMLIVVFQYSHRMVSPINLQDENLGLSAACALVVIISCIKPLGASGYQLVNLGVGLLLPPIIVGIGVWRHPICQKLIHDILRTNKTISINK